MLAKLFGIIIFMTCFLVFLPTLFLCLCAAVWLAGYLLTYPPFYAGMAIPGAILWRIWKASQYYHVRNNVV